MKTSSLKTGVLIGLTLGVAPAVQAQEWSFGPKVNLGISAQKSAGSQLQIGDNRLTTTNSGDAVGSSVGAFARYDRPHWYGQIEASRGRYYLTNTIIDGPASGFATYPRATRTDLRVIAGLKPLPWLRLNAGLGGNLNRWKRTDYATDIESLQNRIIQFPDRQAYYWQQLDQYLVADALQNSYQRANLEAQFGLGVDVGGLTLDLVYAHSLTPVLDGVSFQNQSYPIRQPYDYWSVGVGYKLVPLSKHLLALHRNRAYQRLQRDIPFYRHEFHVGVGLTADDIGSQLVYENRYTRYLSRRIGVLAGLNLTHRFPSLTDSYGNVPISNQITLLTGVRFLPLYSRRHIIGLTAGPLLTYSDRLRTTSGTTRNANGQTIQYLSLSRDAATKALLAGWHGSVDYQFALTDRFVAGPWLRILGQSILVADYATFGVQAGYRF